MAELKFAYMDANSLLVVIIIIIIIIITLLLLSKAAIAESAEYVEIVKRADVLLKTQFVDRLNGSERTHGAIKILIYF